MYSGYNFATPLGSSLLSSVQLQRSYDYKKYRMMTIFHPPFNGPAYFRAAWDDTLKIGMTPLDKRGADAGPTVKLYDVGYTTG
jgi:hypothetical protein